MDLPSYQAETSAKITTECLR